MRFVFGDASWLLRLFCYFELGGNEVCSTSPGKHRRDVACNVSTNEKHNPAGRAISAAETHAVRLYIVANNHLNHKNHPKITVPTIGGANTVGAGRALPLRRRMYLRWQKNLRKSVKSASSAC
ncbi:MAG: hypothetical protein LBD59_10080 [Prevotellaceae bacterium]|nr:hypothetical protein [Prevotellaceae bacterium]